MELLTVAIGLILLILAFKFVQHLFSQRFDKIIIFIFLVVAIFLLFSYAFKDAEVFEGNKIVQESSAVAGNVIGVFKEKVDTESLVNSTVKSNKLFKS